ncbi:DVU3141 family protein [Marinobacter vinifirmus]|uniref:Surface antigen domain-containing protein n=1 Tax=Marinobacter vinifirmus TaxID=355591 RepID=A0A558B2Y0_9GAMM|nr:DVU3141 family protein [Marinobacter vinifirmus]TVT30865.1 MAG: hypothetical protein FHK81_16105 [Marinobacter vinifirmus]
MSQTPKHSTVKLATALLACAAITGCATTNSAGYSADQGSNWLASGNRITWLSAEHSATLSETVQGNTALLGDTPMGQNTRIKRTQGYFSAAGAQCFNSQVETRQNPPAPANVCKYSNGLWGVTKSMPGTQNNLLTTTGGDQ